VSAYDEAPTIAVVRAREKWFLGGAGLAKVFGMSTFFSIPQNFLGTQFLLSSVVFAGAITALSSVFYQQRRLSDSENKIPNLASEVALLDYRINDKPLVTFAEVQRSK